VGVTLPKTTLECDHGAKSLRPHLLTVTPEVARGRDDNGITDRLSYFFCDYGSVVDCLSPFDVSLSGWWVLCNVSKIDSMTQPKVSRRVLHSTLACSFVHCLNLDGLHPVMSSM
jgi:hypothetical protein